MSIQTYTTPSRKPRTKKDMQEYLVQHPRYHTLNSWNQATSYARGIKLSYRKFPDKQTEDTAYAVISSDSDWRQDSGIDCLFDEFAARHRFHWQLSTNGRSGGYCVLYSGGIKDTGYQSFCTRCGQRNYAKVMELPGPEASSEEKLKGYVLRNNSWTPQVYPRQEYVASLGMTDQLIIKLVEQWREEWRKEWNNKTPNVTFHNVCGRCQKSSRINYTTRPTERFVLGAGVDMCVQDIYEQSCEQLATMVDVVLDLDRTVDKCLKCFVDYCQSVKVVEQEVLVPQTRNVIEYR